VSRRLPSLRPGPEAYRRLALAALLAVAAVILTGAAVRLTDSGLGCPDWPTCSRHAFVPPDAFHPLVEFSNRVVGVLVTLVVAVAFVGALRRSPRRRDLAWLAGGLVAGVLAQVVVGGLTVLFKLAPGWVMAHFALSIVLLANAVVLHHRAGRPPTAPRPLVGRHLVVAAWLVIAGLAVVTLAGTATTGSGPHSGSPGTPRLPFPFREAAELHATLAMGLVGLVLGVLVAVHQQGVPAGIRRRAEVLFLLLVAQGAIGYTQYFLRVPAGLVELHILGVTALWVAAVRFRLGLFARPRPADPCVPTSGTGQVASAAVPASPTGAPLLAPAARDP
jgi:cytochrome c oxidase assembly protein subunit 15